MSFKRVIGVMTSQLGKLILNKSVRDNSSEMDNLKKHVYVASAHVSRAHKKTSQ